MKNNNKTEQKLIDNAMRLFKRHGYANVTIDQICDTVEISKNTFYYHFESKDSLLLAYMLEQKKATMQAITDVLFAEKNHFEQFWVLQKKRIDILLDCGLDIVSHLRDMKTVHSAFSDEHEEDAMLEAKIIGAAQADGSVRNQSDSRSLVAAAAMSFFGMLMIWVSMKGAFDFELAMRFSYENIFDVRPDLRRGSDLSDLYKHLVSAAQKDNKKGKNNAR